MASPFFSSYWNQPSESRYSPSSIPLKRKPETPSPKVISIPVHFVGSESNRSGSGLNRSDSALKIQKVFRGFLVRQCVNKIVSIKNEVEEIERRIGRNETVELIRKDSKERLRINETLMALLFKLDSVRGIDSGVRELRKGVIRKAIALQEKVDALVMLPMESASQQNEAAVDSGDIADSIRSDSGEIVDDHPVCDDVMPIENVIDLMDKARDNEEEEEEEEEEGNCDVMECNTMNSVKGDCCKGVQQQVEEEKESVEFTGGDSEKMMMNEEDGEKEKKKKKSNEELQIEMLRMMSELVDSGDSIRSDSGEIVDDHPVCVDVMPIENPTLAVSVNEMPIENVMDSMDQARDNEEEEEGNCDVKECNTMNSVKDDSCKGVQQQFITGGDSEKMMMNEEDGEKKKKSNEELQIEMLRMMSELVEKNELQTQMINSLTHRVGQLEKAFLCDKLCRSNKKSKKRQQHDGKQH